jgi:DDE superfamily endonuclease
MIGASSPGGKKMWCIPKVTPEFIDRMENILDLYAKPYDPEEPMLCFDEKSKQLLQDTRAPLPMKSCIPVRRDYEYKRNGTRNIFITVEPKGGYREVAVTQRRQKPDFAKEITRIIALPRYRHAKKIHVVLDNLNTHFESSFIETFGKEEAVRITDRIAFHYTPKHASWLNMAEIEISVFSKQSIRGRIPTEDALISRAGMWQKERNRERATISWKFTVADARKKFNYEPQKLN